MHFELDLAFDTFTQTQDKLDSQAKKRSRFLTKGIRQRRPRREEGCQKADEDDKVIKTLPPVNNHLAIQVSGSESMHGISRYLILIINQEI